MKANDQLVVIAGKLKGHVFPIEGVVTIGRNPDNAIQIEDLQVSRKHAQVTRKEDGIYIEDLNSGNGTYVNSERIMKCRLQDGEIIRLGREQIMLRMGTPGAKPDPDIKSTFNLSAAQPPKEDNTISFEAARSDNLYKTFFQPPRDSATAVELRNIQKRLQAVYAANETIASERSLEKVFNNIISQAFSLISADNGLIMLKQENSDELSVEYVHSESPDAQIQVSATIVQRAYINGEAIMTRNAAEDSRFGGGQSIISQNITSAMCVPLTHQDERLGVIYVDNHGMEGAFTNSDLEMLNALAAPAATAIKNAQYVKMIEQAYQDTLVALASAIELRDHYTVGHTWRVTNFAMEVARELGWDEQKLKEVRMGGVLHDVGKIAVDNAILSKTSKLTDEEFAQIKVHPERGADLLREIKFLHPLIPYCLYHHERWDGKGYPFGKHGEDIPIEGRLVAVADAFDAMTSNRPYRKGMDPDVAISNLVEGRGTQFDPMIVDALKACYEKGCIDQVLQDYYKNAARSIACPFCSTFIRFDESISEDSEIECNVCHKTIKILMKEETYFGVLAPRDQSQPETVRS